MKKMIIICALFTALSIVSFAQTNTTPNNGGNQSVANKKPTQMTPKMYARRDAMQDRIAYDLTPEQQKSVYDVELEYETGMAKYTNENKQPSHSEWSDLDAKRKLGLNRIITPDQYAKFEAKKKK